MSPSLTLGDPKLDADHAELRRLTDALAEAAPEGLLAALRLLRAHAGEHFTLEDQDLRDMADGNVDCHIDEHAAVLKSLDEVEQVVAAAPSSERTQAVIRGLVAELRRWLPEHVQVMDAGVAAARTRKRLGGVPVVLTRAIR